MNLKALPILLTMVVASAAYAQSSASLYERESPPVINFIEEPLNLKYPTTDDVGMLELAVRDAEKLLASEDGKSWAPYGAVAPKCAPAPKLSDRSKAGQKAHAKALKTYKADCLKVKKACNEITNFGKKHGILSVCSGLYSKAKVLLTTAEQSDYVNPHYGDLDLPEFDKTPVK